MEVNMSPKECAEKLGITTQALFERAYNEHCGIATSPSGSTACDLAWYEKWSSAPPYVLNFVRRMEKRADAPQIDA